MRMHFTLGAYFELHFRQFLSWKHTILALISMRGSRKLCQRGPTQLFFVVAFFLLFLVDKGREDPNTTKSGVHYWPASETSL